MPDLLGLHPLGLQLLHKRLDIGLRGLGLLFLLMPLGLFRGIKNALHGKVGLLESHFQQAARVNVRHKGRIAQVRHDARHLLGAYFLGDQALAARGHHFKVALAVLARAPLHIPAVHGADEGRDDVIVKILNVILEEYVAGPHEHGQA